MSYNYTSKYKINDVIQLNLGKHGIIKPCLIDNITFSESKVYYDISLDYASEIKVRLDCIDSCFIEDLNQSKPNQFALLDDVIEFIDKQNISDGNYKYNKTVEVLENLITTKNPLGIKLKLLKYLTYFYLFILFLVVFFTVKV